MRSARSLRGEHRHLPTETTQIIVGKHLACRPRTIWNYRSPRAINLSHFSLEIFLWPNHKLNLLNSFQKTNLWLARAGVISGLLFLEPQPSPKNRSKNLEQSCFNKKFKKPIKFWRLNSRLPSRLQGLPLKTLRIGVEFLWFFLVQRASCEPAWYKRRKNWALNNILGVEFVWLRFKN